MAKGRRQTGGGGGGGGKRTKIGIGADVKVTGGSKGRGGGIEVSPTLTVERERRRGTTGPRKRKGRTAAQHLFDLRLEEVTPAAKWIARGDRLTAVGSGARLVFLSERGAVGLASREASDAMRAALAASPHAELESLVTAASARGVRVSVTRLGPTEVDGSAAPAAAAETRAMPPAESVPASAAPGRRGR